MDMVWVPPGRATLGSEAFYPEEAPRREVAVEGFWMDRHPVTADQFARFVAATGHVTVAERPPVEVPGAPAGSQVFTATDGPVPMDDWRRWWSFEPGMRWDGTGAAGDHPVTHVAHADALAYAEWAGKALPTADEWEYAAKGGSDTEFWWGDEPEPVANWWQGEFPWRCESAGTTTPVDAFPPNGFGLLDVCGNVWEWTASDGGDGRRVVKGGSHLCSVGYCLRFRPAAFQRQDADSSTSHIGFRCVSRSSDPPRDR